MTLVDGEDIVIPLAECKPYVNPWCHHCPDFAAEHADISFGGLGMSGWTMCVVRTEYGQDVWRRAVEAGVVEIREASEERGPSRCSTGSRRSSGIASDRSRRPAGGRSGRSWSQVRREYLEGARAASAS